MENPDAALHSWADHEPPPSRHSCRARPLRAKRKSAAISCSFAPRTREGGTEDIRRQLFGWSWSRNVAAIDWACPAPSNSKYQPPRRSCTSPAWAGRTKTNQMRASHDFQFRQVLGIDQANRLVAVIHDD